MPEAGPLSHTNTPRTPAGFGIRQAPKASHGRWSAQVSTASRALVSWSLAIVVFSQGAVLSSFRYIRQDGKQFTFTEEAEAATEQACRWPVE